MSDFYPHGAAAHAYGVFRPEGYSERAIYVIDRSGIIRYVDVHDIDQQPDNDRLLDVLAGLEPAPHLTRRSEVPRPHAMAPQREGVVLYCTSWCPDCRRARAYLNEKGIPFTEIDISKDREAARRLREWTGGYETTPTFEIDGEVVIEFDRNRLEAALKKRLKPA